MASKKLVEARKMHGNISLDAPKTLFPSWHILLAEPTREKKCADWLLRRKLSVYLPTYTRQIRQRGHLTRGQLRACIPGYLFVPEVVATPHWQTIRDAPGIRKLAFLRDSKGEPARVSAGHIEVIRQIEAKLNLPPEAKGVLFKVGQVVRIRNDLYWGWQGPITAIESEMRICIQVAMLGRACKIIAPASEIEAI